ncbi:MucB/RseB C-terminal domain-containing protein [Arenimonas sp. MALMAid1274]|uniref:MucB/RseB C-terminal domain-containing protein n=1 Tax=Arenimonas sp. MALMAid1274 TaxID=3411630 RepID=UPI003BA06895
MRLLLVLLLGLAGPLQAAVTAEAWLARIGPALRSVDYHGTLVYAAGGRMETLRVFHRVDGGRERERLVALSGPPREVIRDGDKVMCIGTGIQPVSYDLRQAGRWSEALAVSEAVRRQGYRARLAGEGRIAGHAAQIVDVAASDGWRYGYRLWIERETGLPLRVDLLDDDRRSIEQVAFTDIHLGVAPAEADLRPSSGVSLSPVVALPRPDRAAPQWRVRLMPAGFELRAVRHLPEGVQLLYSDGLASVSVYVEPAAAGLRGSSSSRRGAVNIRSYWIDGWQVLAIGKVPAATVDRFARNLRRVDADG